MPPSSIPSDAQVQEVYAKVLAQYGGRSGVSGIDIATDTAAEPPAGAGSPEVQKVVRVHVEDAQAATQVGPVPSSIDGVKVVVIEAGYGPEG